MNITAINASPNKNGNTATIMKWICNSCEKNRAKVEWINLSDKNISYCTGCYSCLKNGYCPIDDDVNEIKEKIENSNGVIIGTPVYAGMPSAQLKTLIDRFACMVLYAGIFDHVKSFGISTSGVAPYKKVAKKSAEVFGVVVEISGSNTASLKGGYKDINETDYPKLKQKAEKYAEKFIKKIKSDKKTFKSRFIHFLRKTFLKKLILKNPEQFEAIIEIWKNKKWLK
jgi:multimeric flavodoxin WrbA